jgi:hypothetical protein
MYALFRSIFYYGSGFCLSLPTPILHLVVCIDRWYGKDLITV